MENGLPCKNCGAPVVLVASSVTTKHVLLANGSVGQTAALLEIARDSDYVESASVYSLICYSGDHDCGYTIDDSNGVRILKDG